ncbi:MAG TPA: glutamyl-tRNA reductase [Sandaracinaceae bacterium LLY-WYZ-13_1]|nr:glutamyl-tRNA reductase [Sandaracinaceae bacterium LLY-WYZ-13_1]
MGAGHELLVIGMNHRTSPVTLRERLAVEGPGLAEEVRRLHDDADLPEVVLLSTCNRVEVYVGGEDRERTAQAVASWLERRAGEPVGDFLYVHHGDEAVRHTFRVASSLDSLVVGEPQILGQVKEAYAAARSGAAVGTLLDRCFTTAFAVAKRVRSETEIAAGSVSVSSIAGDLATKIFGDLEGRRVLLVGAGEMGEQAAKHLRKSGATLYVLNRSPEKAEALAADVGGHARGLEELGSELAQADVAIASTSSPRFVITPELMKGVIKARRHKPIFLIDIAVPRDVDPRVGDMDNVFLYDVDDLEQVAAENLTARRREAERAEQIVGHEVVAFEKWRRSGALKPTIVGLRKRVRGVLQAELERTLPRLGDLGDKERRSLDKMVDAMTNKLLHRAVSELKAGADTPDGEALVRTVRRLFDLEEPSAPAERRAGDEAVMKKLQPAAGRGKAS